MLTNKEIMEGLTKRFPFKDIEWRISAYNQEKTRGLAFGYVTNRAIQGRLDEVFGPFGWQNEFRPWHENSQLCGIKARVQHEDGTAEWITKWDAAENTQVEAVKGGVSDSMKRAAVQWGIGRYLYDMPEVWVDIQAKGDRLQIIPSEFVYLERVYEGQVQVNDKYSGFVSGKIQEIRPQEANPVAEKAEEKPVEAAKPVEPPKAIEPAKPVEPTPVEAEKPAEAVKDAASKNQAESKPEKAQSATRMITPKQAETLIKYKDKLNLTEDEIRQIPFAEVNKYFAMLNNHTGTSASPKTKAAAHDEVAKTSKPVTEAKAETAMPASDEYVSDATATYLRTLVKSLINKTNLPEAKIQERILKKYDQAKVMEDGRIYVLKRQQKDAMDALKSVEFVA